MSLIRILKSGLVAITLGLLSGTAFAQICGDGGQVVPDGPNLLCVNGSSGNRVYGSHPYDGTGAQPSNGGNSAPATPRVLPSKYGAVALDMKSGNFNSAYDENSDADAKKNALARCGSNTCKIIGSYRNSCIAVSWGFLNKRSSVNTEYGTTKSIAESKVLKKCLTSGAKNCKIMMPAECSLPS